MDHMDDFTFAPAEWIPFRDVDEIQRVRQIKRADIEKHDNPDFHIRVIPDADVEWTFISDLVARCAESDKLDETRVLLMPNPCHAYKHAAMMINRLRINLRNVWLFALDEWADEDGNVAPESWPCGFGHSLMKWFYFQVDEDLRMDRKQVVLMTNDTIKDYSKRLADFGGADCSYTGPGWAGHIAFIDPNVPEWSKDLDEWKTQGARVCNLHPLTVAQNSLHGYFGMSGDLASVPPKAATVGPADIIGAKNRMEINALTTRGTFSSWQRMTTRLAAHGPVTPQVPTSIHQTLRTDFYISETAAADIEPHMDMEY
jgi:6-phosphogluconolactonase/glucosamine-6-phosphate isomerase/deaminase